MADQRFQYNEYVVGANHPTLADTINRLSQVEHNQDGTHKNLSAFSLGLSANQSIPSGAWTKVAWNSTSWDRNSETANGTFTPKRAGIFHLDATVYFSSLSVGQYVQCAIYKNGAFYRQGDCLDIGSAGDNAVSVNGDVIANGTTDYFEIWVFQNSGVAKNVVAVTQGFSGHFVGY